ncbi:MAG TPA: hypothetical protein VK809_04915 [Bacteroidia bacterium]|jgi:hypothetical protein|nr:hypothetical protein [Bacteroidia bacterium]
MNWIVLSSLNEVYKTGKTRKKRALLDDPMVRFLLNSTKELKDEVNQIAAGLGFEEYYKSKLLEDFDRFNDFLVSNNLKKPQTRFDEKDIRVLMMLKEKMDNGDLTELRIQIIEANETIRGVSLMYFKHEKYLDDKPSLLAALSQILEITEFPANKDQQYIYKLECHNTKCIVLCENLDFLLKPAIPRKHNIELWYAGGKNIEKLIYHHTRGLPIFYSCDWDYDGLLIYRAVKEKIPGIVLLYPNGPGKGIAETDHRSYWINRESPEELSNLERTLFNDSETKLIKQLILNNAWIIEESNNLLKMLLDKENLVNPFL